jgi:drug/metabolite transporter (DMT)-like permease
MDTPAKDDASRQLGYSLAVFSSIATAIATVIGKWNLDAISPMLMNALIFTLASIYMSVGVLPKRGVRNTFCQSGRGWYWILMFAITSFVAIWAFWEGVQRIDPSLASFLTRTEVPIVIFLGVMFLKEKFSRWETMGTLLAIVGIVAMKLTLRVEYSYGFWLVLFSSLFFGLTEFISKLGMRHVEPVILAYLRNIFLAVTYWIALLCYGFSFEGLDQVWLGVLALGFVGPILARMVYLYAIEKTELSKVAVISQSQPVFVMLLSFLALGTLPTFREVVGGLFLIAGCVVMIVSRAGYFRRSASEHTG